MKKTKFSADFRDSVNATCDRRNKRKDVRVGNEKC